MKTQARKNESEFEYLAEGLRITLMSGHPEVPRPKESDKQKDQFHTHAWYELFYADRGSATVLFENEKYTLSSGSFLLVPPETVHYAAAVPYGVRLLICSFTVEGGGGVSALPVFLGGVRHFSGDELCAMLMRAIFAGIEAGNGSSACSYLVSLLHRAASLYRSDADDSAAVSDSPMGRIYKIEQLLFSYYDKELPLSYIAEQLHLSERQLSRVIKKQYGVGYREKNKELRMRSAARLLLRGEDISEIARTVGYRSESAFYASFKAYYGLSPAAYRSEKGQGEKR
jgi:AraC-like DNA-binding protein/mannose-6-phosphate isomerase-like protein (cupin superfamily)